MPAASSNTTLAASATRSALEWVVDQYQISQDKRSGVRSDPNRPDDPEYIVRLVGQVVRVSVETTRTSRLTLTAYSLFQRGSTGGGTSAGHPGTALPGIRIL